MVSVQIRSVFTEKYILSEYHSDFKINHSAETTLIKIIRDLGLISDNKV